MTSSRYVRNKHAILYYIKLYQLSRSPHVHLKMEGSQKHYQRYRCAGCTLLPSLSSSSKEDQKQKTKPRSHTERKIFPQQLFCQLCRLKMTKSISWNLAWALWNLYLETTRAHGKLRTSALSLNGVNLVTPGCRQARKDQIDYHVCTLPKHVLPEQIKS